MTIRRRDALRLEDERQILPDREVRPERQVLKDEADPSFVWGDTTRRRRRRLRPVRSRSRRCPVLRVRRSLAASVVLPQPLGPRITTQALGGTSSETSSSAWCEPNRLETPLMERTAAVNGPPGAMQRFREPPAGCKHDDALAEERRAATCAGGALAMIV